MAGEGVVARGGFNILLPMGGVFWSITFWIMLVLIVHAGVASWQSKSLQPFVDEIGSRLVSADGEILRQVAIMKVGSETPVFASWLDTVWYSAKFVFKWMNVASLVFFIFVNFMIIYRVLVFLYSDMNNHVSVLLSVFIMFLLENVWTAYYLHSLSFPFAGVFSLVLFLFNVSNPLYEQAYNYFAKNNLPLIADIPQAPVLPQNATVI